MTATPALTEDTRLRRAAHCVARPQYDQVLIYNPDTDELHLMPPEAYRLVELCEAATPAGTLVDRAAVASGVCRAEAAAAVIRFLSDLMARGILEAVANE